MKIFPNPASLKEDITLMFDESLSGKIIIRVFDKQNTCLYLEWIAKANRLLNHKMHLHHLERGTYLVKVNNAGKTGVQRLMIE